MTLSDLIAVMRDGRLVQFGTQDEIYRRPATTYVATFVGKPRMSLVEGALGIEEGVAMLTGEGVRIPLGEPAVLGLRSDPPPAVAFGVRAEDVRIDADGGELPGGFAATVALLEPIGSDTFVELAVGPATIVARVSPDLPLRIGQPLTAAVAPGRAHLFDASTGLRIGA